jgi:hypothetical protein
VHPGHFDRLAASTHALALHGCEAGSNNVDQHLDSKPVREQECLCAALSGAAGEHLEDAATVFGQLGPGWRGHSRNIGFPERECESAAATGAAKYPF